MSVSDTGLEPQHKKMVLRTIVATQLVLALLTGLVVVLAYNHLNGNLNRGADIAHSVNKPPMANVDAPTEPLNILIMGSDSREGAGNKIDAYAGGGQRADTTILMHVSADRAEAYGVSLPRDALVTRPDCKSRSGEVTPGAKLAMFNTAFAIGGEACTVKTVETLTGIYINDYITLDFNGFKNVVDAVDGVQVCIPKAVDDRAHGITFDAGTQVLTGQQALNYVRERYVLSLNSDYGRMKRQQAFLASMIKKVVSAGTLSRPTRVLSVLNAATRSLTVSPGLDSVSKLADLALQFKNTGLNDIQFITVPYAPYEPDPNRLIWAPDAAKLWGRIKADKPLSPKFSKGVISASDRVGPSGLPSSSGSSPSKQAKQQAAQNAADNGLCA